MAVQRFTVAEYRARFEELPLPNGDEIEIFDSSGAIAQLTVDDIQGLAGKGVTLLNAEDNALALNLEQLNALGTVGFSSDDRVTLRDSQSALDVYLQTVNVQALSEKGISVIDSAGASDTLRISWQTAIALLATDITFDASDTISISDPTGRLALNFFSAPEIMTFGSKGIDFICIADVDGIIPIKLGAVQAKALANSGIRLSAGGFMVLGDDGTDIARLTAIEFAKLASKGPFAIDALDNVLALSFDQYKALEIPNTAPIPPKGPNVVVFDPFDEVTLELRAADLMGLGEAELVKMADRGVDVLSVRDTGGALSSMSIQQIEALKNKGADILDASDNALSFTYSQYKAANGMAFAASDAVTVSLSAADVRALTNAQAAEAKAKGVDNLVLADLGQALAALTAADIAALSSKGISTIDAADNKLTLSLDQFSALGSTKLTASDTIRVLDAGAKLSSLSAAQIAALSLAGVDELDASNDSYTLSSAQYDALGSIKLSAGDRTTILADADVILSNGGTDVTLTGNAIRGTGNSLANIINGNAKNNILAGLGGGDFLYGGSGKDQLSGGLGQDIFVFDTKLNKSTNVDKVLDFKSKDDSIYLDNKFFTKLGKGALTKPMKLKSDMFVEGAKAKDKEDRIVYDKKTGSLYYDADGTGKAAQVKIATIANKEKLFFHDLFVI